MINLLPPETKHQIRAARHNVTLRNYCLFVLAAAFALAGVFFAGFQVTLSQKAAAEADRTLAQQAASQYQATRSAAEAFTKDLATAKNILATNVNFSQLITDIAGAVPSGVILNNLSLSTTNLTAPIDISGRSKNRDDVIRLKNSLEDSPIFEDVQVVNITEENSEGAQNPLLQQYPININLTAKFSKKTDTKGAQ